MEGFMTRNGSVFASKESFLLLAQALDVLANPKDYPKKRVIHHKFGSEILRNARPIEQQIRNGPRIPHFD
jgi:hypothetical protein